MHLLYAKVYVRPRVYCGPCLLGAYSGETASKQKPTWKETRSINVSVVISINVSVVISKLCERVDHCE